MSHILNLALIQNHIRWRANHSSIYRWTTIKFKVLISEHHHLTRRWPTLFIDTSITRCLAYVMQPLHSAGSLSQTCFKSVIRRKIQSSFQYFIFANRRGHHKMRFTIIHVHADCNSLWLEWSNNSLLLFNWTCCYIVISWSFYRSEILVYVWL